MYDESLRLFYVIGMAKTFQYNYTPLLNILFVNLFYEEVVKMIRKVPRRDILIVMGDFNAKVGEQMTDEYPTVVGKGGLGSGNEAGERLVEFCLDNELRLSNTWFEHHPRRLYTWTSPDGNMS